MHSSGNKTASQFVKDWGGGGRRGKHLRQLCTGRPIPTCQVEENSAVAGARVQIAAQGGGVTPVADTSRYPGEGHQGAQQPVLGANRVTTWGNPAFRDPRVDKATIIRVSLRNKFRWNYTVVIQGYTTDIDTMTNNSLLGD